MGAWLTTKYTPLPYRVKFDSFASKRCVRRQKGTSKIGERCGNAPLQYGRG